MAMYRAKRGGADRVEIFRAEMRAERDDRVQVESDLRKALERGELKVLYQPIVYLPTEELAGFEALVRWEHPQHGLLNPAEFVPVAEESDLIVKLGSYVLQRAAREVVRWQRELPRSEMALFVSVNVSSRQLFRQDLIQEIRHILGKQMVPKGSLRLEVTESLVMENPERASELLELLRGTGAELALDDFGVGYSSLAYLQRFPFDTIKIDRAIVQSCGSGDGAGAAIMRSMVALGHELGKKIVAEGVEEPQDVAFLRSLGCEFAQGFYYGEAMPDREVLNLLRIVSKSERKLQARGFFRTKAKKGKSKRGNGGAKPQTAPPSGAEPQEIRADQGAAAPPPVPTDARPLPNRQLRPRHRAQPPPAEPIAARHVNGSNGQGAHAGAQQARNGQPHHPPPAPRAPQVAPAMTSQPAPLAGAVDSLKAALEGVAPVPGPHAGDSGGYLRGQQPEVATQDAAAGNGSASRPATRPAPLDLSTLPPGIAESLAKLSGR